MAENFAENVLRGCLAFLQFQAQMTAAQQMFAKGYFALSVAERIAVDQAVLGFASSNFQAITQDYFGKQPSQAGFLAGMQAAPSTAQTESSPGHKVGS